MTTDEFTNRLSEYIDGELEPAERVAIDAHLAGCVECRSTLDELRAVVARASSLEDSRPAGDPWAGIAARIAPGTGRAPRGAAFRRILSARRFSFTLPQLAAAAVALMVLSGGLVWMARSGDPRADFEAVSAEPSIRLANFADRHYDDAVADLQRTLDAGRANLDPETVRVLEENLAAIDRAIEQSRRALSADPANVYLNRHLADARQRKLALLRRALTAGGG
jgi:predicted anti-sigma-YlaC factor YlaD